MPSAIKTTSTASSSCILLTLLLTLDSLFAHAQDLLIELVPVVSRLLEHVVGERFVMHILHSRGLEDRRKNRLRLLLLFLLLLVQEVELTVEHVEDRLLHLWRAVRPLMLVPVEERSIGVVHRCAAGNIFSHHLLPSSVMRASLKRSGASARFRSQITA